MEAKVLSVTFVLDDPILLNEPEVESGLFVTGRVVPRLEFAGGLEGLEGFEGLEGLEGLGIFVGIVGFFVIVTGRFVITVLMVVAGLLVLVTVLIGFLIVV